MNTGIVWPETGSVQTFVSELQDGVLPFTFFKNGMSASCVLVKVQE